MGFQGWGLGALRRCALGLQTCSSLATGDMCSGIALELELGTSRASCGWNAATCASESLHLIRRADRSFAVFLTGMCVDSDRGSTGYGEDSIQSLPGNIGTNDVADCMAALDAAISEGTGVHHSTPGYAVGYHICE